LASAAKAKTGDSLAPNAEIKAPPKNEPANWAKIVQNKFDKSEAPSATVLSIAKYVADGASDLSNLFCTILAQFAGSFFGGALISALGAKESPVLAFAADANNYQVLAMEILYTAIFAKLFLTAAPKDVCGTFWHVLVIAFMVVVAGNSLWLNRYIVDSVINSGDAVSAINSMVVLGSILGSIIGAVIYKFRQE
jgi:hypothetical protein